MANIARGTSSCTPADGFSKDTCRIAQFSVGEGTDLQLDTWFPRGPVHSLDRCEAMCRTATSGRRSYAVVSKDQCRCATDDDLEEMLRLSSRLHTEGVLDRSASGNGFQILRWTTPSATFPSVESSSVTSTEQTARDSMSYEFGVQSTGLEAYAPLR